MTIDAIEIDNLVIDEETGEILEGMGPDAPGRVEQLITMAVEAQRAVKAWEQAFNAYRAVLGRLLQDQQSTSLTTPVGSVAIRARTTRRATAENLRNFLESRTGQIDVVEEMLLWRCAKELDPKRLDELASRSDWWTAVVVGELIEETTSTWVQVSPPRPEPPVIERVKRDDKREGVN